MPRAVPWCHPCMRVCRSTATILVIHAMLPVVPTTRSVRCGETAVSSVPADGSDPMWWVLGRSSPVLLRDACRVIRLIGSGRYLRLSTLKGEARRCLRPWQRFWGRRSFPARRLPCCVSSCLPVTGESLSWSWFEHVFFLHTVCCLVRSTIHSLLPCCCRLNFRTR